jgi:hypothetical protein
MLRTCQHPECTVLTLGTFCVAHEPPAAVQRFPRGRPYSRRQRQLPADPPPVEPVGDGLTTTHAVSFGGGTKA